MIIDDNTDQFLAHYGVKGMKWGVRKERRQERRDIKGERKQRLKEELNKELEIRHQKLLRLPHKPIGQRIHTTLTTMTAVVELHQKIVRLVHDT